MKKFLATYEAYVSSVKLKKGRKSFTIGFIPKCIDESGNSHMSDIKTFSSKCYNAFMEMLDLDANIKHTPIGINVIGNAIKCYLILDLEGNYLAISDLNLAKIFAFDDCKLHTLEEIKQMAKNKQKHKLYKIIETHQNAIEKAMKDLEQIDNFSADILKCD